MQYYYADGDEQKGPVELNRLKAAGITPQTLVWREGMGEWQEARTVPELASLFAAAPASPQAASPYTPTAQPAAHAQQPAYQPTAQQAVQQGYPAQGSYPQQPGYAQPGPYGQPLQYGGYAPVAAPPSQGMSVASLVLGILGLLTSWCYGFGLLLAILAVIFGHIGYSSYKRETGQANGMAIAGLVCGYISLSVVLIIIVWFVLVMGAIGAAAAGA